MHDNTMDARRDPPSGDAAGREADGCLACGRSEAEHPVRHRSPLIATFLCTDFERESATPTPAVPPRAPAEAAKDVALLLDIAERRSLYTVERSVEATCAALRALAARLASSSPRIEFREPTDEAIDAAFANDPKCPNCGHDYHIAECLVDGCRCYRRYVRATRLASSSPAPSVPEEVERRAAFREHARNVAARIAGFCDELTAAKARVAELEAQLAAVPPRAPSDDAATPGAGERCEDKRCVSNGGRTYCDACFAVALANTPEARTARSAPAAEATTPAPTLPASPSEEGRAND